MHDESYIVAAAVEGGECVVETVGFVPVDVQVAKFFGAYGVDGVGCVVDLLLSAGNSPKVSTKRRRGETIK